MMKKIFAGGSMEKFLSELLHTTVAAKEYSEFRKLPLFLQAGYERKLFSIADTDILFIKPKEQLKFNILKKQWKKFEELTELPCVIYDDEYTRYGKERMVELGIPFVFGKDNIYMPFLGVVLLKKRSPQLPDIEKFSPMTQKLVVKALYDEWREISSKEISEYMGVSRMTVTRCLVELQALGLPLVQLRGNTKYFVFDGSKEKLYHLCSGYFDNPIGKVYYLGHKPKGVDCLGGFSAISQYSMLADNEYKTYALSREEAKVMRLNNCKNLPKTEEPECIIHVLRYKIVYGKAIDPISAILCIPEEEKDEPRVEQTAQQILEDVFNGRWDRNF